VPCDGPLADNYDGVPAVICESYHQSAGAVAEVRCEDCRDARARRRVARPAPVTHVVDCYTDLRRGRRALALCSQVVEAAELSDAPTCPECQRQMTLTADDVFGAA